MTRFTLPRSVWALIAAYFIASLAHFSHNAAYIAVYPGMPQWLTASTVYAVWGAITLVGALGWGLYRFGYVAAALALLGIYGAFGLDGLAHYTLGLCADHTLWANVTIWSEAISGLLLFIVCMVLLSRRAFAGIAARLEGAG